MKKIFLLLFILGLQATAQVSWQGGTIPNANASATLLFDKTGTNLASYTGTIYAHTGVTLNGNSWQNVLGQWGSNSQPALTLVSGNIYKLVLSPTIENFYGVTTGTITKINIVFRNEAGNAQTADLTLDVGAFQTSLSQPTENSTTMLTSGQNFNIAASNTNGNATYTLKINGVSQSPVSTSSFSYNDNNITTNKNYVLEIVQGTTTFTKKFSVLIVPTTNTAAIPTGLEDGINYHNTDATKATLVLNAPGKDFVYVAGSFNNWQPDNNYAMKKDPTSGKFWLEIKNLTSGQNYTYQYWVADQTPTNGSPALVKTADPFSTLVLSPFDDAGIPATTYPNMPPYPTGQEREVTVLKTGQTPYNWSAATTNFVKPSKDNLVVYEVLIRDFDASRNIQSLIDKIDYFKNLKINAIELMPIMEFEGNESWGYNTAYHLALDKFYGTKAKMQEFIDLCHQNGIAVILDVALNHAFGRNPMVRMWMKDADGDGWGDPASDNPYFNEYAKHSYSVGSDFNHAATVTQYYTKRVVKHWIEEFKIDGFRWDLTKGFTQECAAGDDSCTNGYREDRVAILKNYADYSWSLDPNHYVIFEHLGADNEEQQWANYRLNETPSKGVMMWGELTYPYTQLAQGVSTGADISRMGANAHGFSGKRLLGYPESHDKERLMYSAINYGNANGTSPVFGNLNNALFRMSAIGATSLLIPGPKMIWHFAELGMNNSIYTCTDGTVNTESDTASGDCKLSTKPQPQWANNWTSVSQRSKIYTDWAKMIDLKKTNPVFNGNYTISPDGNNIRQRIYVFDDALPSSQLKNVVILANFSVAAQNVIPDFPYTGTWVNLMDNTTINVTNTATAINIESGGFRIFGNQSATLSTHDSLLQDVALLPNPTQNQFSLNKAITKMDIYALTGQLIKHFEGPFDTQSVFNIQDMTAGIYLVKIWDNNQNHQTLKLIKE
ncbi:alpha-amylase family glycosyl hydrolase [Flavobacterium branchiophilum]|uniref:Alpha-amylase n=1 Tax=Flavobacterium branchiophilum TaxID=55197 RepID=A0A2H3KDH6_9FLAO|nr:alpha-amylase family glycosyl hydrolase [Flavobacterium branchiophilum]PDS25793.1 alpha-amylase [Flavobacterium branchiophilum]